MRHRDAIESRLFARWRRCSMVWAQTTPWAGLREALSVQRRVTASFTQKNGRALHARETSRPETDLVRLYAPLGLDHLPGEARKLTT